MLYVSYAVCVRALAQGARIMQVPLKNIQKLFETHW